MLNPARCGTEVYDAARIICCGGITQPKDMEKLLYAHRPGIGMTKIADCCGARLCDPATAICCRGNLKSRISQTTGNPATNMALECCVADVYDRAEQLCCDDVIINKTLGVDSQACCGSLPYSPAEELCFDGVKLSRPSGTASRCCGQQVFNSFTTVCVDSGQTKGDMIIK